MTKVLRHCLKGSAKNKDSSTFKLALSYVGEQLVVFFAAYLVQCQG